jgi:RNA polymerase sigma-70 factor, ECF subfamily
LGGFAFTRVIEVQHDRIALPHLIARDRGVTAVTHQKGASIPAVPLARAPIHALGEPDDATLAAAAIGNPAAFAPLYNRYVEPIYRYCYRRVSDRELAADLTSAIFTRAIEALPKFRPRAGDGATFRAWLFTIAHNVVVDHHRRARPRGAIPIDTPDLDPGPEARAVHGDAFDRLMAVLDQIPEQHRQIIELRLAGLTSAEIAATLSLSRAAVKSAQTRAYARLRDLLGPADRPGASS